MAYGRPLLATVWLDVVLLPLVVAGVERIGRAPDATGGAYGESLIHADYTHSLLGALVLSALFGLVFLRRWGRVAAIVLAAVAFSHWILELVAHRADMPLLPGNLGELPLLGLGVWRYPIIAALLEVALVGIGAYMYWRAAARTVRDTGDRRPLRLGVLVLASGLVVLGLNVLPF